jgi:hypothetical protein
MIESITLVTLCILYLVFFRPGKTEPLKNPLVIERGGQYHMTLAPQLNLAQPFVEDAAKQIMESGDVQSNSLSCYFEVSDKQVTAHGENCYLLAVTRRNGMLYFQAAAPKGKEHDEHVATISVFANKVLERFPAEELNLTDEGRIVTVVQQVAAARGIKAVRLS